MLTHEAPFKSCNASNTKERIQRKIWLTGRSVLVAAIFCNAHSRKIAEAFPSLAGSIAQARDRAEKGEPHAQLKSNELTVLVHGAVSSGINGGQ